LVRVLLEQPKKEYQQRGLALLDESLARNPNNPDRSSLRYGVDFQRRAGRSGYGSRRWPPLKRTCVRTRVTCRRIETSSNWLQ
jgi:hypothetical protein